VTAGDIGVAIVCGSGGYNMTGLTTVTLRAAPGKPGKTGKALILTPVSISNGGVIGGTTYPIVTGGYGIYVTTGTDFLQGGAWQLQLQVPTLQAQKYTAPQTEIYVFPLL
jgi:hypothetical protein